MKKLILGLMSLLVILVLCVGCSAQQAGERKTLAKEQKIQTQEEQYPEEVALRDLNLCRNLTNNVVTTLKDFQTIDDEAYTEVTITSPDAWDRERLPGKVLELEAEGYSCKPIPLEIEMPTDIGDSDEAGRIHPEPMVTKVRWNCELEYAGHKYLKGDSLDKKKALEEDGYRCAKIDCRGDSSQKDFVWFCSK